MTMQMAEEAVAFDNQISERIANGHIPDLRRVERCEWFNNNPWRDPEYVKLDFGEQATLIDQALREWSIPADKPVAVLEVGCGPGYLSLELARLGHRVTGIDVSPACIEVAERFASTDPWVNERAELSYLTGDFFTHQGLLSESFDAVVFLGALHHFSDQKAVMSRVRDLLREGGIIIAHEPTRDRVTPGNVAFCHLLRTLLSAGNGFHISCPVPLPEKLEDEINGMYAALKYENESGENIQSPHDNDAGFAEMHANLTSSFRKVILQERYAFFHEFIGGLRFDYDTNVELARYLRDMDSLLCKLGVVQSTEFFFVGRKETSALSI